MELTWLRVNIEASRTNSREDVVVVEVATEELRAMVTNQLLTKCLTNRIRLQ